MAIGYGVVAVIYDLSLTLFLGIPKLLQHGDPAYLKAKFFTVLRDLHLSFAWLIVILNEPYGRYNLCEAEFQQKSYDKFITRNELLRWVTVGDFKAEVHREARKTTLYDYKMMSPLEKLVKRFYYGLQISRAEDRSGLKFEPFLAMSTDSFLKALTLKETVVPWENSLLKYAMMHDDDFLKLKVCDLEKGIGDLKYSNQDDNAFSLSVAIIKERLKNLGKSPLCLRERQDVQNMSLKDLISLSSADIQKWALQIPPPAFAFFCDEQLKDIKLLNLSPERIRWLFFDPYEHRSNSYIRNDNFRNRADNLFFNQRRFDFFAGQNLYDLIQAFSYFGYPEDIFHFLKCEHLNDLKISELSQSGIDLLFTDIREYIEDIPEEYEKLNPEAIFAKLSAKDIQKALEMKNYIPKYELITPEQWRDFNFVEMSQDAVNILCDICSINDENDEDFVSNLGILSNQKSAFLEKIGMRSEVCKKKYNPEEKNYRNRDLHAALLPKEFCDAFFPGIDPNRIKFEFKQPFPGGVPLTADGKTPQTILEESKKTLGLASDATDDDVKKAYKKLAAKYHPDKNPQREDESNEDFAKRLEIILEEFKKFQNAFANYKEALGEM